MNKNGFYEYEEISSISVSTNHIFQVAEMTENIKSSFQETIKNAPWLDASTKMAALNKLDYMIAFISHESWLKSSEIIEKIYVGVSNSLSIISCVTYAANFKVTCLKNTNDLESQIISHFQR